MHAPRPTSLIAASSENIHSAVRDTPWVRYALYPALLGMTLLAFVGAQAHHLALSTVFAWLGGVRLAVLLLLEARYPAKLQWKMTWASFRRDLKYMAVNGGMWGFLRWLIVWLALDLSRLNTGILGDAPMWVETVILILVFEFFQYWYHRWSHEMPGPVGQWLWKVHAAHHLPDKVYLLMHPAGHPINLLLSLALVQLPLVTLGARPEAIFLFNALMGLQGWMSHFNANIQAGPLNYVLVGTELHRYHHSAKVEEAKNYGVLTPFWDIVFGTFVYRPGQLPEALGVSNPEQYPQSTQVGQVLAMPFRSSSARAE